jgi:ATP-dependent DNA ligase
MQNPRCSNSDRMEGDERKAMFRHACRLGLEGIVSKRATSRYKSGRCLPWRKVENPAYERGGDHRRAVTVLATTVRIVIGHALRSTPRPCSGYGAELVEERAI